MLHVLHRRLTPEQLLEIAKVAMKAAKEVRTILAAMNSAGIIAMQEVPKGADRAPIRTFYLW